MFNHNAYNVAAPARAAFAGATQYATGGVAPRGRTLLPPVSAAVRGRSMAAACEAAGYSAGRARLHMLAQMARLAAGLPLVWPAARA